MKSNLIAYPKWVSWLGSVALLATTGAAGLGICMTQSASLPLRLVAGLVGLMAALSAIWLYRIRAAHRFFAALDAYAEQELDRAERRPSTSSRKTYRDFSSKSA